MIIDASVAFKWMFVEEQSDIAVALLGRGDLRAPSLLLLEIGNALWKKRVKGEISDQATLDAQLGLVASLISMVDDGALASRALEMAVLLQHATYDCVYLALAEREGDVLITADWQFLRKVMASPLAGLAQALA